MTQRAIPKTLNDLSNVRLANSARDSAIFIDIEQGIMDYRHIRGTGSAAKFLLGAFSRWTTPFMRLSRGHRKKCILPRALSPCAIARVFNAPGSLHEFSPVENVRSKTNGEERKSQEINQWLIIVARYSVLLRCTPKCT